ncbi:unnamed protein product (macronuclear) [Paramecium tetraurelia]|uniref:EF-hand domain-containing protein n=1 Tax=Paramecium tetraurelia TaxID=5888 RepID=A0E7U4_PARTE|nr:uncharacterized protein GSPATT00024089001 [Paramecium tetraurelia]CAK91361.1 unnamed protein product [Paramecium tetraurelia]|eukprot:XP_001458758.1 hypothetical protein (macronuclear) [Paramecium tetraurelia strain d4-2]
MINNELDVFVKKAYQHNLLGKMMQYILQAPLMNKLRIRTQIVSRIIRKDQNKKLISNAANTSQNEKISQQKFSDEDTERSNSKLLSSFLLRQERKNTLSPSKMVGVLSNSKEEMPQQFADVFGEINRIEVESDNKNIRINKQQLATYLQRYYPDIICEQIVKVLKIPQILTFNQYYTLIRKIENLDLKQQIRVCFLFYDLNNQAEITTQNLVELLKQNANPQIELDILHMIKQTKIQISNQINNDVKQILPSILPLSVLRVQLDQSVILSYRKQSVVSNDGRKGQKGKVSQRNSLDLNIEIDQDSTSHSRNTPTRKKVMLITQINKEEQKPDVQNLVQHKSERKKNKSKLMKDENKNKNKISIDLNKFINIWYPQKPNLFNDLLRNLTAKP